MREVFPLMEFLKEADQVFDPYFPKPKIHCKVFEDNNSCIAMTEVVKFSPITKHIALKYHHFRRFVKDIFTNPLDEAPFYYLRNKLLGW